MKTFAVLFLVLTCLPSHAEAGTPKEGGEGQCFDLKQSVIKALPRASAASRAGLEGNIATLAKDCSQPQLAYLLKKELGRRVASVLSQR
jgi:hypothetical protein